ncbi:MAG TPA: dipeptide epimerase [Longimicrobiales bacterium]|nr:dipeptide epimerase [Longimicrobiales bacterium]
MRLELEVLELRTRHAFHIARARGAAVRRSVWARLVDEDGTEGWGEAPTSTPYYGETADTALAVLPVLWEAAEAALAEDGAAAGLEEALAEGAEAAGLEGAAGEGTRLIPLPPLERLEAAMADAIGYNAAARVALSAALHDLVGKRLGQPLWRLWGLDPAAAPASSFTIGIDAPEVMRERVREASGYPVLKVKIGTARDEEILGIIREEAPAARLLVDANTAWSARTAVARLPMLEAHGVEILEQPLHPQDLDGWRELRRHARIPIVADESCRTSRDVARLAGHVDGINIKLAKCGSLREAVRMAHTARAHGMLVMLGCMVESTLGIAAGVQLAPLVDYADLDGAALLAEDPFEGPGLEPGGRLRFNTEPGLGVHRR